MEVQKILPKPFSDGLIWALYRKQWMCYATLSSLICHCFLHPFTIHHQFIPFTSCLSYYKRLDRESHNSISSYFYVKSCLQIHIMYLKKEYKTKNKAQGWTRDKQQPSARKCHAYLCCSLNKLYSKFPVVWWNHAASLISFWGFRCENMCFEYSSFSFNFGICIASKLATATLGQKTSIK